MKKIMHSVSCFNRNRWKEPYRSTMKKIYDKSINLVVNLDFLFKVLSLTKVINKTWKEEITYRQIFKYYNNETSIICIW